MFNEYEYEKTSIEQMKRDLKIAVDEYGEFISLHGDCESLKDDCSSLVERAKIMRRDHIWNLTEWIKIKSDYKNNKEA